MPPNKAWCVLIVIVCLLVQVQLWYPSKSALTKNVRTPLSIRGRQAGQAGQAAR
jgi:hypothetical protein